MSKLSMIDARRRYEDKRRDARQAELGILPTWKAVACIDAMKKRGATFEEAWKVLQDVMDEKGLKLRADNRFLRGE